MPAMTALANAVLNIIYRAQAYANMWDNAAASPDTNVYASLHSASPGAGGTQATNEATYTSYARVAIPRTTAKWTAPAGGLISNVDAVEFPSCTGGPQTETDMMLGRLSSGAGAGHHYGTLNVAIPVANTIQPRFIAGAITIQIT